MSDIDKLYRHSADLPTSDPTDETLDWWRGELEGAPPLHEMRTDTPRPSRPSSRVETADFDWDGAFVESLQDLAASRELPVQTVVLAGFATLVERYTSEPTVVLGVPIEGLSGDLLPVRIDFEGEPSFADLLDQVADKTEVALAHRLPFETIVERLDVGHASSYAPVTQLASGSHAALDGASVDELEVDESSAMLDLTLLCDARDGDFDGTAVYNAELFEAETIERMLGHLQNLLAQSLSAPSTPIREHSLPTDAERRVILEEWNDTDVPVDLDRGFHRIFEDQVDRTPDDIAVVEPGGGELTYRELDRRANQIAHHLTEKGLGAEDLVAVCVERSLDLVTGIMGVMKSGAAYVPINPTYPEERIDHILAESDPAVALTDSALEDIFAGADADLLRVDTDRETIEAHPTDRLDVEVDRHDLAYMVYTSGSTGKPKGVMIEHGNVANLATVLGPAFGVEADDRVSQFVSETFDATIWEFAMTFTAGATLVLLPKGRAPLGLELGQYLRDEEVTMASIPPAVVPDIPKEMAEGVETMIVAGEACPAKVVEEWAPGRRFMNGYGPREASAYATTADCEPNGEAPPIGRPIGNYKAYVLDEDKNLLPVGVEGELYIGGPGVGRGYLDRPELNAEKYVDDPFVDGEEARMYKTGDVVRWRPDGQLAFIGRRDFQVQLRGFRVELGAIEEALREHEEVSDAVCIKHESDNGTQRLVGYVVAQADEPGEGLPERLTEALEASLPDYMVPSHIVLLDEMPLNTTGKVDRHALPAPEVDRPSEDRELTEPRTDIEEAVAAEWSEMLGLEKIGVDEDFFDLGGTSLMIARLALRIKDEFDVETSLKTLYETPTVAAIAEKVEEASQSGGGSALCFNPSLNPEDEGRLTPDITGDAPRVDPEAELDEILLTGATGFVGAHLLAELLEQTDATVHCLIRGRDPEHLAERLEETFEDFELEADLLDERVEPHVGDLAADRLGLDPETYTELAGTVDAIYHNGAKVDQVRSYEDMKPANVTGTKRMLRFAGVERVTPFHFVSTLGSVHYTERAVEGRIPESAEAGPLNMLPNGYMQTKCVGEQMVRAADERGIPTSIYRLGAVSGHTGTGVMEPGDFTYSIIRSAVDLGVAPDLNPDLMITPVDFVAHSIAALSRWSEAEGKAFHVTHPQPNHLKDVIGMVAEEGYDIEFADYDAFLDRLSDEVRQGGDTPLLRFLPYLNQRVPGASEYKAESYYAEIEWDCDNLQTGLEAMGEPTSPPAIQELVPYYVETLREGGYL